MPQRPQGRGAHGVGGRQDNSRGVSSETTKTDNMNILINNNRVETAAHTVADLAAERSLPGAGVAVAVNNRMVPRTDWAATTLCENDSVVIIKAACGG